MEQFGSNLLLNPSCLIHLFYRNKTRKKDLFFRFLNTEVNSDDRLLPSVKFYHLDEITNENKQEYYAFGVQKLILVDNVPLCICWSSPVLVSGIKGLCYR